MKEQKIEEYRKLLADSETVLRTHPDLWKEFLRFATRFTHYGFYEQLLMYAQDQNVTACATYEQWKKIGRYVRSGENGIALLDESGKKTRLRYVFDVTASGPNQEFKYRPEPVLEEEQEQLARRLSNAYASQNAAYASDAAGWEGDLTRTLSQIALYMTEDDLQTTATQAADLTQTGELPPAFVAAATSAMYLLLDKYGLSTDALDFSYMTQLTPEEFQLAGTTASNVLSRAARMVRHIMPEIRQERSKYEYGRENNGKERNDDGRYPKEDHLSERGRLLDSEHRTVTGGRGSTRTETLRDDEEKLSEGESSDRLRDDGIERDIVQALPGDRSSSGQDQRNDVTETGEGSGSNGRAEDERSDGVGAQNGDVQSASERSDLEGTDLSVAGDQLTLFDYMELDPVERDEVSIDISETDESSQESLSDTEKIVETVEAVGETPTAFSISNTDIPESEIIKALQYGSGIEDGKIRIAALFRSESDASKRASFLKEEYGIGGHTNYFEDGTHGWVDWDAKGIHIYRSYAPDSVGLRLPWSQVEKRLGELIRNDQYLKPSEKEELSRIESEYGMLPSPKPRYEYPLEVSTEIEKQIENTEPDQSSHPEVIQEQQQAELVTAQNFHITDAYLGEGRPREKYQANVKAIRLLKELEAENRNARPEEQEILSKYVGWGGLADVFDEKKTEWNAEYQELKALLSEDEYEAARASTLNAHYTSPTIIKGIYSALEQIGFKNGSILEPAMGVGNFFGMLPDSMQESRLYGVEMDSISGRIAKKLYPKAQITVAGFETTDHRDFYDVAIGNVPFGNYRVNDRAYNRLNFSIHNYFFAKSLDQVRPGGIVAFITSHYTMDAKNSSARRYLAQSAESIRAGL